MTREDVESMGLTLGPLCDFEHRRGMAPHHHIEFAEPVSEKVEAVFFDQPMTVTVDLEDNPTLVGWVMNDE